MTDAGNRSITSSATRRWWAAYLLLPEQHGCRERFHAQHLRQRFCELRQEQRRLSRRCRRAAIRQPAVHPVGLCEKALQQTREELR